MIYVVCFAKFPQGDQAERPRAVRTCTVMYVQGTETACRGRGRLTSAVAVGVGGGGCFPGNDTGFPGDVPDPTRPPTRPRAPRTSQLLLTIYMLRRTHSYRLRACPKEGKIAIVCAQVMACACSASLVSHRLCFIHSHPHSYSIARSSRMPWRRCSRPARATAPRTFTHGPVGRGSQASPPACMPCHVLSLASSLPLSLSLRLCGHADRDAAHFSQLGE